MPKLLQINVTSNWGSTGKIAEQIGVLAQQQGWDSYVAYGRYANPSQLKTIKIGTKLDVYRHYAENRFLDREGLASQSATQHFLKQVDKIKPDIVHLHNIHGHYLNYPLLFEYLKKKNIPVVWTLHDCWAFTGHCYHFEEIGCERWKKRCYQCPQTYPISLDKSENNYELKNRFFTSLTSLTLVPVSDWLGGLVKDSYLKNQSIRIIKNGIDLNIFKPQIPDDKIRTKYDIGERKIIMGCASVWPPSKGFADFIQLRELLPVSDYVIILVGLYKEQISTLPDGIIGIERTNSVNELASLYSIADVFVNPTYSDNYPTTNLEAMACGTPVITYKTGGSPEAVDDKTGFVVEQGNILALAKAIKEMKQHPLSSNDCRKRAEEYFDKEKCYEKYIQLYNDLINKI